MQIAEYSMESCAGALELLQYVGGFGSPDEEFVFLRSALMNS